MGFLKAIPNFLTDLRRFSYYFAARVISFAFAA
jgi:hypothetical protein